MEFLFWTCILFCVFFVIIFAITQIADGILMYKEALKRNDSFFVNLPLMQKARKKRKLTGNERLFLIQLEALDTDDLGSPKVETKLITNEYGYEFWVLLYGEWNCLYSGKYMLTLINSVSKYMVPCP